MLQVAAEALEEGEGTTSRANNELPSGAGVACATAADHETQLETAASSHDDIEASATEDTVQQCAAVTLTQDAVDAVTYEAPGSVVIGKLRLKFDDNAPFAVQSMLPLHEKKSCWNAEVRNNWHVYNTKDSSKGPRAKKARVSPSASSLEIQPTDRLFFMLPRCVKGAFANPDVFNTAMLVGFTVRSADSNMRWRRDAIDIQHCKAVVQYRSTTAVTVVSGCMFKARRVWDEEESEVHFGALPGAYKALLDACVDPKSKGTNWFERFPLYELCITIGLQAADTANSASSAMSRTQIETEIVYFQAKSSDKQVIQARTEAQAATSNPATTDEDESVAAPSDSTSATPTCRTAAV